MMTIHGVRYWSRSSLAVMLLAVLPVAACAQQTDTTITVAPNVRIQIQNFAGSVTVRACR